mmetsp:Transcript_32245/g.55901  ORF Transcript_32245/g.55901 Transcript_32245/m.55901 type:complete len:235 (+) Transcript_32245:1-705(+)
MRSQSVSDAENEEEEEDGTESGDEEESQPRQLRLLCTGCCCATVALCTGLAVKFWVDYASKPSAVDGSCMLLNQDFVQGEEGCWQTTTFNEYYRSAPCLVSLMIIYKGVHLNPGNKTWLRYEREDSTCLVPHTVRRLDDGKVKMGWYPSGEKNCAAYLAESISQQNQKGYFNCNFMVVDTPTGAQLDASEAIMADRAEDMLQSEKKLSLILAIILSIFACLCCIFTAGVATGGK